MDIECIQHMEENGSRIIRDDQGNPLCVMIRGRGQHPNRGERIVRDKGGTPRFALIEDLCSSNMELKLHERDPDFFSSKYSHLDEAVTTYFFLPLAYNARRFRPPLIDLQRENPGVRLGETRHAVKYEIALLIDILYKAGGNSVSGPELMKHDGLFPPLKPGRKPPKKRRPDRVYQRAKRIKALAPYLDSSHRGYRFKVELL